MPNAPLVSIVTPCHNAARFIAQTIESVRAQTLTDWEHIVVDDGSTDGSAAIVEALAKAEPRLRLVRQENLGASAARNSGYAKTNPASTYLWFLDADDCLEPHALVTATRYLDDNPEAGIAYSALQLIDSDGRVHPRKAGYSPDHRYVPGLLRPRKLPLDEPVTPFASLFAYYLAIPSTCCMRRSVYERTGGWDERFERAQDKDLVLQMAMVAPVHLIPQPLVRYRRHDTNLSGPSVYKKLKPVHEKWWRGEHLTPDRRTLARAAIVFDKRLAADLQFQAAFAALRAGRLGESFRHLASGVKKTAIHMATYGHWIVDGLRERVAQTPPAAPRAEGDGTR